MESKRQVQSGIPTNYMQKFPTRLQNQLLRTYFSNFFNSARCRSSFKPRPIFFCRAIHDGICDARHVGIVIRSAFFGPKAAKNAVVTCSVFRAPPGRAVARIDEIVNFLRDDNVIDDSNVCSKSGKTS